MSNQEVNYIVSKTDLTSVANAIRSKGGTTAELTFPNGFNRAIKDIDVAALAISIIERSISELKIVSYPGVTNIGSYAFYNCSSLSDIDLPYAETIGDYAFYSCSSLTLPPIGYQPSFLSANQIGRYAFFGCSGLTEVFFPEVTYVGEWAFGYCVSITKLYFPMLTTIKSYAFSDCSSITEAYFPQVTNIEYNAFSSNYSLRTLILESETLCAIDTARNSIQSSTFVYVPKALELEYKDDVDWYEVADNIRAIEDYPEICDPIINGW